ncbi:hypothetical protein CYY_005867 [Polysphondylium violaceum]|uniref:Elongator complex protein 5 n=1 Tax=Polysphondylium violaceum TaxID=133409 RepID=A0A8J4V6G7_9MYCE|nr:hypothetical protein CYY_005867 [Polysphondylium violaceum]
MSVVTPNTSTFLKVFQNTSDNVGGLILLEDTIESSSQNLLNHMYSYWLPTTSKQHRNIWFLNFNNTINEYKQLSKKYNQCNFVVIDFYSDPFGWNQPHTITQGATSLLSNNLVQVPMIFKSSQHDSNSIVNMIQNVFNAVPAKLKESPILLINSISTLVLKNGLSDTCSLIRTLINYNFNSATTAATNEDKDKKKSIKGNKMETGIDGSLNRKKQDKTFTNIFAILHTDLHEMDITVSKELQYISSVSIQVTELSPKLKYSESLPHPYESTITLITKKRSGRVVRNVEYYYINSNGKVEFDSAESLESQIQEAEVDPTENLSFNLKLSEEEKLAKNNVVLPYRHQGNDQTLIIEDPDEEDFDDEDPDDDLDI